MSTPIAFDRDAGLITEGPHFFRIVSVEEQMGPKGPFFMWHLTVEERSVDNGKTGIFCTSLSPSARWKMCEFLDAVQAPPAGSAPPESFVGRLIRGNVIHEVRDERLQNTIDSVLPSGITATTAVPTVTASVAPAVPSPPAPPAPDLLAGEGAAASVQLPDQPLPLPPAQPVQGPVPPDDEVPF